jgi:aldehyde:ferredoxin oxidoreductase
MNALCNQYGLDTISAGGVIAFAMECWEKGLITAKDTSGLDLSWGNHKALVTLVHWIANREGFGRLLAKGVKRASEAIPGSSRYAMHVKGLEPPAQGVRGLKAWALAWAVASRGADHLRAFPLPENIWREEDAVKFFGTRDAVDRFQYNGKARLVKWCEEFSAITDCLEMCKIPAMAMMIPVENMAEMLSAATGVEFTAEQLMTVGERVVNLERLYNGKLGFDRKDDRLPDRMREEPVPEGNSKGQVVDENQMLDTYYQLRGWDGRGLPTSEKLARLEIST